MRFFRTFLILGVYWGLLYFMAPVHADGDEVAPAKAAEFSLHRIENLVILKKIDKTFVTQFKGFSLIVLEQAQPEDPRFRILAEQFPAQDGSKSTLEVFENKTGKPVKHIQSLTTTPVTGAPLWPLKDPVTLSENALHYILDNESVKPDLVPFHTGLSSLELVKNEEGGELKAEVRITRVQSAAVLKILINTNGDFESYVITNSDPTPIPSPSGIL